MRVLITGSRVWYKRALLKRVMAEHLKPGDKVILGGCPRGVDRLALLYAYHSGIDIELHPAQWDEYGDKAGPIRNQQMVDSGADLCLAFIRDHSRGATDCANRAEAKGIPTVRIEDSSDA